MCLFRPRTSVRCWDGSGDHGMAAVGLASRRRELPRFTVSGKYQHSALLKDGGGGLQARPSAALPQRPAWPTATANWPSLG